MPKPILISGIQPTGKLHLGNYLGALKNFVELQNSNKYHCHFFIADLHSLTEDFNPKEKSKQILELAADFLAAGLNPKKSTIFIQSQIPAHSELAWVLNTITPFGELGRMTQFKEKSEEQKTNVNVGLFTYPILMAADVLLYDAEFVPVGHDQLQHLEFTRTIARKFNNKFGKTFIEPKALLTKTPRIMSLDNPDKKMSKSQPNGCLFLNDSPKTIQEKLARAVTDSGKEIKYDPKEKPAISNLLMIYSALSEEPVKSLEQKYKGKGYAEFKKDLAKVISDFLKPFQKSQLKTKSSKLKAVIEAGTQKAEKQAQIKIQEAKEKIGLNL
jgi:tryptophanyl-tRNA synthetase